MSIIFMLIILFVFSKYVIKCRTRKSYIITGLVITGVMVLSEIYYIISSPINYLKYEAWQVALAFIIYLIYVLCASSSGRRNKDFNRNIKTKTKEYFNTAKMNGLYLIIISIAILLVGVALLIIRLTKVYEQISIVVYIGSIIGFIAFLVIGIISIKSKDEKFILFIKTEDENYTFKVDIKNKFKFKFMDYIGDIYRYYIIENLGTFKYSGDIKEIHYVWILRTENLNNYDISKLPMEKTNNYWYNEIVDNDNKFRNTKFNIEIENNEIKNIK